MKIFISYVHEEANKFRLLEVIRFLETKQDLIEKVYYWQRDTGLAEEFEEYMLNHIREAEYVIFFCSNKSLNSDPFKKEIAFAQALQKKRFPIYFKLKNIPKELQAFRGLIFQKKKLDVFCQDLMQRLTEPFSRRSNTRSNGLSNNSVDQDFLSEQNARLIQQNQKLLDLVLKIANENFLPTFNLNQGNEKSPSQKSVDFEPHLQAQRLIGTMQKFLNEAAELTGIESNIPYKQLDPIIIGEEGKKILARIFGLLSGMEDATKRVVGDAEFWFRAGKMTHKMGWENEAEQFYRMAILHDPNHSYAWNNLGMIVKDGKEAERYFRKAMDLNPDIAYRYHKIFPRPDDNYDDD